MSVSGILVLIALTVGVLAFIAWPLIVRAPGESPADESQADIARSLLERDYKATLATVRDLDFDFQTGKLTPDDYRSQREALVARGAALLRQIDTFKANSIEAAIAEQRAVHTAKH